MKTNEIQDQWPSKKRTKKINRKHWFMNLWAGLWATYGGRGRRKESKALNWKESVKCNGEPNPQKRSRPNTNSLLIHEPDKQSMKKHTPTNKKTKQKNAVMNTIRQFLYQYNYIFHIIYQACFYDNLIEKILLIPQIMLFVYFVLFSPFLIR